MKVSKVLQAPVEFLYDKVLESSQFDIKQQTGRTAPSINSLSGFSYEKIFLNHQKGKITFGEVKRPRVYEFVTETDTNAFTTRWEFEQSDKNHAKVSVSEKRTSKSERQWMNDVVMGIFLHYTKRKRIVKILEGLESQYKK
ncbi:MAG: DUF3284 domain-containing protein [Streptococcaceae bacterium]|jgi:hypothetical protein|nr:DUF3284 domain-containing protein [Streptococcaceae bacterium]